MFVSIILDSSLSNKVQLKISRFNLRSRFAFEEKQMQTKFQ